MIKRTIEERFWEKVRKGEGDECWVWTASTVNGYGRLRVDGEAKTAHRVSWELNRGPIPDELHVLHKCDNKPCINPTHLFLGTNADNVRDCFQKDRSGRAKLKVEDVLRMRKLYSVEKITQGALVKLFGVAQQTVSSILNRTIWAHLPIQT